ncbi:hypothetical protein ACTXT7_005292 [Hymenolepis weldensis]
MRWSIDSQYLQIWALIRPIKKRGIVSKGLLTLLDRLLKHKVLRHKWQEIGQKEVMVTFAELLEQHGDSRFVRQPCSSIFIDVPVSSISRHKYFTYGGFITEFTKDTATDS